MAALVAGSTSAFGAVVGDINIHNTLMNAGNLTQTGTFNITIPNGDVVVGAAAQFWMKDDGLFGDTAGESFTVDLGGQFFASGSPTLITWSYPLNPLNQVLNLTMVADLNNGGDISYTVTRTTGDFIFVKATLEAVTRPGETQGVPDGGTTAALLGLGMVGLAGLRRKLA